jgi:cytoskeleton protein RodZ
MPPIGETLREARMRQGLDIADVEERTKIRARYLRALENEEWGLLPGSTFVKTFLRTYAELVGVDAHLLVEEYRTNHEVGEDEALGAPPTAGPEPPRPLPRRGPPGPPGRGAVLAALAFGLVVFLLVLGLLNDDGERGGERAAEKTEKTATGPRKATRRRPMPSPRPAAPKGVTVRLAPSVPTYVCVDTGPGTAIVFQGILERARTFKTPDRLRLNLGKRSVALQANGKPVTIEPSPAPAGFEVTRQGSRQIAEGSRPCA